MKDQTFERLVKLEENLQSARLKIVQLQKQIDAMATLVQIQIFELAEYEHPEALTEYPTFLVSLRNQKHLLSKIIDLFSTETRTDEYFPVHTLKRG